MFRQKIICSELNNDTFMKRIIEGCFVAQYGAYFYLLI